MLPTCVAPCLHQPHKSQCKMMNQLQPHKNQCKMVNQLQHRQQQDERVEKVESRLLGSTEPLLAKAARRESKGMARTAQMAGRQVTRIKRAGVVLAMPGSASATHQ